MRHSWLLLAISAAVLGSMACAERAADMVQAEQVAAEVPPAPSVLDSDTVTGVDSDCGFVRVSGHANPDSLIAEFLRRDAAGEFLETNDWFSGATDCPDHEGGPDTYTLIASYEIRPLARLDTSVAVEVRSHRLGLVTAGVSGSQFDEDLGEIVDTVRARRTGYGWRIASPALRLFVRADAPARRLGLLPADSARVLEFLSGVGA